MKISSLVDIVNGTLVNKPAISFVTQSHTNIKKVNDGDLFISSSQKEIEEAILKGAFAIIYDFDITININLEIALIRVSSIEESCTKLLRFYLSTKSIQSYFVDDISYELVKILKTNRNDIVLLNENKLLAFEQLKDIDSVKCILSRKMSFINDIYPLSKNFMVTKHALENLTIHSLFETTFSNKDTYYSRVKLSKLYINHLLSVLSFLDIKELDASKLKSFRYMQAIFINKNNQIVEYGKSNRFIIANDNQNLIENEINFINKYYSYANIKIIDSCSNSEIYFNGIKNQQYNALYIKCKDIKQIVKILEKNYPAQASLI